MISKPICWPMEIVDGGTAEVKPDGDGMHIATYPDGNG